MKLISQEVKQLQPIQTIAIKHVGEYSGICEAFEKLATWAGANNLWVNNPKMAGIYHDDPSSVPTAELHSHACLENLTNISPSDGMEAYTISGGKYFVTTIEVTMSEYGDSWKKAYTAVAEKGFVCDMRDHYELYVSCAGNTQDPDAAWIVDLCIPIK